MGFLLMSPATSWSNLFSERIAELFLAWEPGLRVILWRRLSISEQGRNYPAFVAGIVTRCGVMSLRTGSEMVTDSDLCH